MLYIENYFQHDRPLFSKDKVIWLVSVDEKIVLRLGLTIAAKFTITIVIDSQSTITIVSTVYILYIFNQLIKQFMLIPVINKLWKCCFVNLSCAFDEVIVVPSDGLSLRVVNNFNRACVCRRYFSRNGIVRTMLNTPGTRYVRIYMKLGRYHESRLDASTAAFLISRDRITGLNIRTKSV